MPDPAPALVLSSTSELASSSPPKPFKCPKCPRTFKKRTGLGSHLRAEHNVKGKSGTAIALRQQREAAGLPMRYQTKKPKKLGPPFECPQCHLKFKRPQVLGRHLWTAHNVPGKSKEALRRREEIRGTIDCPNCDFRAINKAGLAIHLAQKHHVKGAHHAKHEAAQARKLRRLNAPNSAAIVSVNEGDNHASEHAENGAFAPATLQVALGRFQEFCKNFAAEYDLPPRMFAARFAELIYAAQVRQSLGGSVRMRDM